MTRKQRLLALEAALCACEGCVDPSLVKDLVVWIDNHIDRSGSFGKFLDEQKEAVQLLAKSPEVFGA